MVCPDCNLPLTPELEKIEEAQDQEKVNAEVPEVRPSTKEEEQLRDAWIKMLSEAVNRYRRSI